MHILEKWTVVQGIARAAEYPSDHKEMGHFLDYLFFLTDQKDYKRLFETVDNTTVINKKTELQQRLVSLYLQIWEYFSASFVP